ncbi:acetylornithine aminotransferase apoenzyme [Anaerobranca californiensis DSM 14826]|jgi:acetylornithine/N-succinyldiaminopimelate aminotransferase|uniref:Acetylornithine aminotransferase n=1 Tax=Anaerobranca californiensis DSM 14826 TaxID=1120989 RepID=A0A1M6RVI3_9FIRM|nr:aspartate aminotransferase family protein [Anaerobranca californiensis]SHK36506.1 acetylornithine aminotransferase apoenzyme [Anaerobranca californiensis DSM 14826]
MENILLEDKLYILNTYRRMNLNLVKGEGSFLWDDRGRKYLDMFSGIAVNNLGYGNKEIKEAIIEQLDKYNHISNFFVSESVVNLAKLLVENSFGSKVFFCNSGTEANEAALKLARKYGRSIREDKSEVLTFYNSFHGRTYGGLSLTGQEKYKEPYKPSVPGIKHINFNDCKDLKDSISEKVCAVFLELIQGEGGIKEVSKEFIEELVILSKKYRFLIIVDEIQTGLGRTGDLFAYQGLGFTPHIITLAKALGGGLPLGAMVIAKELENVFKPGDHGSTFGGNPVACAAGVVVLRKLLERDFLKEVKGKSDYLLQELIKLRAKFPQIIIDIRGKGLIIGLEVGDYADRIKQRALEKGVLLNITSGTVLRLLPPLTITYEELDLFLKVFSSILEEISEG